MLREKENFGGGEEEEEPHLLTGGLGTLKQAAQQNRRRERRERPHGQNGGHGDLHGHGRSRGVLAAGPTREDGGAVGGGVHPHRGDVAVHQDVSDPAQGRRRGGPPRWLRLLGRRRRQRRLDVRHGRGGRERETLGFEKLPAEGAWESGEELIQGRQCQLSREV